MCALNSQCVGIISSRTGGVNPGSYSFTTSHFSTEAHRLPHPVQVCYGDVLLSKLFGFITNLS
jgi:hypothetical protein